MLNDIKQEFWGDLQADFYTKNSAVYLANQSLKELISTNGKKVHKPIMSHSQVGTYTPYSDISFQRKTATDNTLTVDQFKYAADEIDITDKNQSPYELLRHSLAGRAWLEAFELAIVAGPFRFQPAAIESSIRRIGDGQMESKYQTLSSPIAPYEKCRAFV